MPTTGVPVATSVSPLRVPVGSRRGLPDLPAAGRAVIARPTTEGTTAATLAVIDSQTVSRLALPLLLPEFTTTGTYRRTEEFLSRPPAAEVVVMDLHLAGADHRPVRQRLEAVRAVTDAGFRVLVYTDERSRPLLVNCLIAGARGIVHKSEDIANLRAAIRSVVDGEVVITQALVGLAELADRRHLIPTLTARQHQVLAGRARGERYESIAARLYVSKKVAEEHWSVVAAKFADFLCDRSPADLERLLGLDPGDLLDWLP